tara:strand:+ start:222 stop:365 length:144 start_codon:yes stop_codon:yes gene_type:complete
MFVTGFVIFSVYITGIIYMINWGHNSQEIDETNDPEINDSNRFNKKI